MNPSPVTRQSPRIKTLTGILLSKGTLARYRDRLAAAAREAGIEPRVLPIPDDPKARLAPADLAGIATW